MVKQGLGRTMFLLIGLVLIFAILRCQIWENPADRLNRIMAQKRAQYTIDIHAKELDEFLKLLPEYKKFGFDKDFYVPYLDVLPSGALDWKKRIWFLYHHWDANRFYYVQQRLIYLLQALEIRRDAQAIIDLVLSKEEIDDVAEQMIELQKQRIKAAEMSFSELILISAREKELKKLLK
ncbi:MAG: hypothetical protein IJ770_01255 [Alphaproteobacteria bacterium]|nr:hypothetical protein [Alphaproteobacteria bacterium]